jgi:hypothetical protein
MKHHEIFQSVTSPKVAMNPLSVEDHNGGIIEGERLVVSITTLFETISFCLIYSSTSYQ